MSRLIDDMAEVFEELYTFLTCRVLPVMSRYDFIKQQEAEIAKLTEEDTTDLDEASDYTALDPEYEHDQTK